MSEVLFSNRNNAFTMRLLVSGLWNPLQVVPNFTVRWLSNLLCGEKGMRSSSGKSSGKSASFISWLNFSPCRKTAVPPGQALLQGVGYAAVGEQKITYIFVFDSKCEYNSHFWLSDISHAFLLSFKTHIKNAVPSLLNRTAWKENTSIPK